MEFYSLKDSLYTTGNVVKNGDNTYSITGNGTSSYVSLRLEKLNIGDVIEVEYDISGSECEIAIDRKNSSTFTTEYKCTTNNNRKAIFIVKKKGDEHRINIGLFTNKIGNTTINAIKYKISSKTANKINETEIIIESKRMYMLNGGANGFTNSKSHTNDNCTITHNTDNIEITHSTPFTHTLSGTCYVQIASSGTNFNIGCRPRSQTNGKLNLEFYNTTTNEKLQIDNIKTNNTLWINVIHFGYEKTKI